MPPIEARGPAEARRGLRHTKSGSLRFSDAPFRSCRADLILSGERKSVEPIAFRQRPPEESWAADAARRRSVENEFARRAGEEAVPEAERDTSSTAC